MRDATRIEEMKDEHTCTCWEERGRSREEIKVHGEGEVRGVHNKEKGEAMVAYLKAVTLQILIFLIVNFM